MYWENSTLNRIYKSKKFKHLTPIDELKNKKIYIEKLETKVKSNDLLDRIKITEDGCLYEGNLESGFYYYDYITNYNFNVFHEIFNTMKAENYLSKIDFSLNDKKNIGCLLSFINSEYLNFNFTCISNIELFEILTKLMFELLLLGKNKTKKLNEFVSGYLEKYLKSKESANSNSNTTKDIIDTSVNNSSFYLFSQSPSVFDILLLTIIFSDNDYWDNTIYPLLISKTVNKQLSNVITLLNSINKYFDINFQKINTIKEKDLELLKNKTQAIQISTSLQSSVKLRDLVVTEELLKKGENVNSIIVNDKKQKTILHYTCSQGNLEMVKLLVKYHVDINAKDWELMTCLYNAVESNNTMLCDYLLNDMKMDINQVEIQNRTIFYWACCIGDIPMIKYLIDKGVDINKPSSMGRSAFSKACWNGRYDIIELLLSRPEILINERDGNGRTPLHNAVWGEFGGRLGKKMSGVCSSDSPLVAELLLLHNCDREVEDNDGFTPLMLAASTHGLESLKKLIAYGGDVNRINRHGGTACTESCKYGNFDSMETILIMANDCSVDLTIKDDNNFDVFDYCVCYDSLEGLTTVFKYNESIINKSKINSNNKSTDTITNCIKVNLDFLMNLLHISISHDSKRCFNFLLKKCFEISDNNDIYNTLLQHCVYIGRLTYIKLFIKIYFNYCRKSNNNRLIDFNIKAETLLILLLTNSSNVIENIINEEVNVLDKTDGNYISETQKKQISDFTLEQNNIKLPEKYLKLAYRNQEKQNKTIIELNDDDDLEIDEEEGDEKVNSRKNKIINEQNKEKRLPLSIFMLYWYLITNSNIITEEILKLVFLLENPSKIISDYEEYNNKYTEHISKNIIRLKNTKSINTINNSITSSYNNEINSSKNTSIFSSIISSLSSESKTFIFSKKFKIKYMLITEQFWIPLLLDIQNNSLLFYLFNIKESINEVRSIIKALKLKNLIFEKDSITGDSAFHILFEKNCLKSLDLVLMYFNENQEDIILYYKNYFNENKINDGISSINSISDVISYLIDSKNNNNLTALDVSIKNKNYELIDEFIRIINIFIKDSKNNKTITDNKEVRMKYQVKKFDISITSNYYINDKTFMDSINDDFLELKSDLKQVQKSDFKNQPKNPFTKFLVNNCSTNNTNTKGLDDASSSYINVFSGDYKERVNFLFKKIQNSTLIDEFNINKGLLNSEYTNNTQEKKSDYNELFITNENSLIEIVKEFSAEPVIGVDMEFYSEDKNNGVVCLMQLSSFSKSVIVDTLVLRNEVERHLKCIFEDKNIVKVFQGFDNDLLYLKSNFNITPQNIFDTARAYLVYEKYILNNKKFKAVNSPSLGFLSKTLLKVEIDKSYQKADWRLRPLTQSKYKHDNNNISYFIS